MQIEMLQTMAEGSMNSGKVFYMAAQKRNIYKSVRFVELDSAAASPTASADEDVVYYYEAAQGSGTYYYVTEKTGKQVFAYDRGQATPAGKVKAFLEALQLQAIRQ
jgi:hypothetical protein